MAALALATTGAFFVGLPPATADNAPGKVSGAVYTTNAGGTIVNQNQYAAKTDVYLSGGPNNANAHFLAAGNYFFAILDPGGQGDPNDNGAGNLSIAYDHAADRTFTADGLGHNAAIPGVSLHTFSPAGLVQAYNFADTNNAGGVYIAAVCQYVPVSATDATPQPVDPKSCKYDAFKVKNSGVTDPPVVPFSAPTADKTAVATHTRTVTWTVGKTVDGAASKTYLSSPKTVSYTVTATKNATDTYGVTGTITVTNPNADPITVNVTDNGLVPSAGSCDLTGSGSLIVPGAVTTTPGQNSVDYACSFTEAPLAATNYTNTATVTYVHDGVDVDIPVASAPFQFPSATLTAGSDPETVDVTDTFNGGTPTTLATALDHSSSWTYNKTLGNSDCVTYPNTAALSGTTQSASTTVTVCGPNSGGLTMGWWQNKNGQSLLTANIGAACGTVNSYLPGYVAGTSYLPDAYTAGSTKLKHYVSTDCATPGTTSYLPTFDLNVFSVAAAAGTGTKMLEGQWLTTAMDTATYGTYTSAGRPTLKASTGVVIPSALQVPLSLGACDSVKNLLTSSAAQYASYSTTKAAVTTALIPLFTSINQSQAQTCPLL